MKEMKNHLVFVLRYLKKTIKKHIKVEHTL